MSDKQKIAVALGLSLLVAAFVFIYRQFDSESVSRDVVPPPMTPPPVNDTVLPDRAMVPAVIPETPDAVVDDVLMSDADMTALDAEEAGETQAAQESVQIIDDITETYDDQQL